MKTFLKKSLSFLGVAIFLLLIIKLIIQNQYSVFFYYAFLVLHSFTVILSIKKPAFQPVR